MVALVTNNGLAEVIAAWLAAGSIYVQAGAGSGQGVTSNDLAVPVQTRELASLSQDTTNVTGDTLRATATVTATGNQTITEVGMFDALTGGSMEVYGDFAEIDLATGDAVVFTISITVT